MISIKELLSRYSKLDFPYSQAVMEMCSKKHVDPAMDILLEDKALGLSGTLGYRLSSKEKGKPKLSFYSFSPYTQIRQERSLKMKGALSGLPDTEYYYHLMELELLALLYGRKVDYLYIIHVSECRIIPVERYGELAYRVIEEQGLLKPKTEIKKQLTQTALF